jgi:hypothetical protein
MLAGSCRRCVKKCKGPLESLAVTGASAWYSRPLRLSRDERAVKLDCQAMAKRHSGQQHSLAGRRRWMGVAVVAPTRTDHDADAGRTGDRGTGCRRNRVCIHATALFGSSSARQVRLSHAAKASGRTRQEPSMPRKRT